MDHSFLDIFVFLMFLYMYDITRGLPQKRGERIGLFLPLLINIVVVIVFMPQLEYRKTGICRHSHRIVGKRSFAILKLGHKYDITRGLPQKRGERIGLFLPLLINIVVVIVFMPQLEYRKGTFTNYSMGMSAYTCFAMVALYVLAASGIFLHSWKNLERQKQIAISTYL